jgi:DNA polymerase III subunit alpha
VSNFIDLHCHSTFSSAITAGDAHGSPVAVVERAKELGWGAVCLTEHGWLGSAPLLYKEARKAKIKPIIGCELYVTTDELHGVRGKEADGFTYHLTVLALSREGYENLVAWTTEAMRRENYHRKPRIGIMRMVEIAPWPLHHNVVLSGCLASELNRGLADMNGNGVALGAVYVEAMRQVFPNFYIEVWNHEIPKFMDESYPAYTDLVLREKAVVGQLLEIAEITGTPVVLTNDSHMQKSSDRKAHIAQKANSWRHRDDEHYGKSPERQIAGYLKDYTYFGNYMRDMEKVAERAGLSRVSLQSIDEIVSEADIRLEPLDNFRYSIPFSGYNDPIAKIRKRSAKRLRRLLERHGEAARIRFEHELEAMGDFAHYLLLMSNFIVGARKQGILTWTRGSAANSLLCYCLYIHDIDPMPGAYDLIFSRFFNPARKKLPDIDIDIDPDRYEDFMSIVKEYMDELEGEGQVAQICNYGTLANRSAFRTVASAMGIPKEQQDEISKLLPQMIDSGMVDEEQDVYEALKGDYPELYELTSGIFDSIKNVSQHACGWLFGTKDRPISEWVPLYLIASSGKMVTQYDWKFSEEFGLVKGDFLRLKTLAVATRTLRMIGKSPLDFHKIPVDDPETFEMFREGRTEGVHTLQGKENRKVAMELGVESVHDVIAAAAIGRPALTREGKDRQIYARRRGEETVDYPHEIVEEILGPTYGIPIFQEQVMEICYAAGMDDAGVDDVYQAIKKAKGAGRGAKEAFQAIRASFLKAAKRKVGLETAKEIWENYIFSSRGYGFNKGHATSYGILACRTGWLKRHYPAEHATALLDVYPEKHRYVSAARSEGYHFEPPSVNESQAGFSFNRNSGRIVVGLGRVDGLGPVAVGEILAGQPFRDYEDFKARTTRRALNAPRLEKLATIGALECLGVRGNHDDATEFEILGFCISKPKAFRGCKPKHVGRRVSDSGWKHLGLTRGAVAQNNSRTSVSKLFWIPPGAKLELKTSPWAHVKTWLLTAVDENGLAFDLMVNEDKEEESTLINFLHRQCQGNVFCADGMIRQPFTHERPIGFRFFGITGAYNSDPQIWGISGRKKKAIVALDQQKRSKRR